jgi:pimeloyl-ACP methyl ester carboxylesterase
MRDVQAAIPGAELVVFDNSSHMASVHEPEAFMAAFERLP